MKKQVKIVLWTGLFFLAVRGMASPLDLAKAVHYLAPTNFYGGSFGEARSDPGDNPVSLPGLEFLSYMDKNDRYGLVTFQLGLVGAYVGEGKVVKFLPTEPIDLKKYMEAEYEGKFPKTTPVATGKIDGLASVSITATRPPGTIRPYFFHFCWIQIETNIVVKISAYSCNTNSFSSVTNSLQSIKIDKPKLLEFLHSKTAGEKL